MSCHSFCDEAGFSLEEIRQAAAEGKLLTMEMEFSQLCNFNCPYCYLDVRPKDELSSDEIRDLILQARELGVRRIIILGGEPMIYPRILEKIHFIRNHGIDVELFTNGSNMTAENAAELAVLDVKVVLKMNTQDADVQNRLCGINDADRIIRDAFRHLTEAGYGPGGKPMAVSSVISSANLDELPAMWRWLRDQKIDPYFEMITPQGSAVGNDWLYVTPKQVEHLFNQLAEIDRTEYGREWKPQPPLAGDICLRHQFSCYVNAFGDVMPCVGVTLPVGNIRKIRLADVLRNSEVMQDLKTYRQNIKGPCASCEDNETCYGCRGAAYQLTGDYLASDPLCWRNIGKEDQIDRLPMISTGLIPQQPPMRMVDKLLSVGEKTAEVETTITADCVFVDETGCLDPVAFIEIIAQTAALFNGFRTRHLQSDPQGFLLGVKKFKVHETVRAGDRLVTTGLKDAEFGGFTIVNGMVLRDSVCVAEGQIKIFHQQVTA